MTFDQVVADFKSRQIPINWLDKVRYGFKCIGCGNGSGKNGTGATISKDRTRLLCGKCGKAFSYIDVACNYYHIDLSNFVDGVKQLCQAEGIDLDTFNKDLPDADTLEQQKAADFFLHHSCDHLKDFLDSQGGKWRGLDYSTLHFLNWQFCDDYKHPHNNFSFPAMLIPNDNGGLLARQIDGDAKSNLKPSGTSTIFLPDNPKFILAVEGSINGASILQALGTDLDFAIISANGTSNKNLLVNKIFNLFPDKNIPIAIAFDFDENKAGQNAAVDALNSLIKAGYTACTINITKTAGNDLNDLLNANNGTSELSKMLNDSFKFAKAEFDRISTEQTKKLIGRFDAEVFSDIKEIMALTSKFADRKTGFSNLDKEMAFLPGIYVIGGLPALGKTTFALQLLEQAAQQGEHCFFCSYEMSENFLHFKRIARAVYQLESLNGARIIDKPLTAIDILSNKLFNHKDNFDKVLKSFIKENIPFHIWEFDEIDIDKLLERIDKICNKFNRPPIICLDYLQLLAGNNEQAKAGIDNILRKLKTFQRDTDTTFIIVSSLNRLNYNNEISFESFKESGGIEYTADVMWGLQFLLSDEEDRNTKTLDKAKRETPRHIQLKCLKNRFGANFDIGFNYFPAVDYFQPMDELSYLEFTETSETVTDKTKIKKSKYNDKD